MQLYFCNFLYPFHNNVIVDSLKRIVAALWKPFGRPWHVLVRVPDLQDEPHPQVVVPRHVAVEQPEARVVRVEAEHGEPGVRHGDRVLQGRVHKVATDLAAQVHVNHSLAMELVS